MTRQSDHATARQQRPNYAKTKKYENGTTTSLVPTTAPAGSRGEHKIGTKNERQRVELLLCTPTTRTRIVAALEVERKLPPNVPTSEAAAFKEVLEALN
ncbi:unnamed protein product [Ceratitis capitata]|uniref:(Mediterranean fruit fly) hypothetical protein n=1 Tax=Ceratitis capitata TaxID=7213 RepID=A0A811VG28_CERCA|nr:unnamed protein product [Ceratitis capitata]